MVKKRNRAREIEIEREREKQIVMERELPNYLYVRVERKIKGEHPWYGRGSPMGYAISFPLGAPYVQGPTISVPFDSLTTFSLFYESIRGHPFYITRDPVGGTQTTAGNVLKQVKRMEFIHGRREENPPFPVVTDHGQIHFVPSRDFDFTESELQRLLNREGSVSFYYQCDNHPHMGGVLEVYPSRRSPGDRSPVRLSTVSAEVTVEKRLSQYIKEKVFRSTNLAELLFFKQMEGINQPVFGVPSKEEDGRYFYVGEQHGKIWQIDTFTTIRGEMTDDGDPMEHAGMWGEYTLFFDVSPFMKNLYSSSPFAGVNVDERGLLGMDFHPEFHDKRSSNRDVFFLYFSTSSPVLNPDTADHYGCLYRFLSDTETIGEGGFSRTIRKGIMGSGNQILCVEEPYPNHNGGTIMFSPVDSLLYVGLGDGGSQGDPGNRAQSLASLHGKILRLDVDAYSAKNMPYRIPDSNPFVPESFAEDDDFDDEIRREIYAYGLRNPWGLDFDSEGRLIVADVGENTEEEVNIVLPGGNYGWPYFEGTTPRKDPPEDDAQGIKIIPPAYSYGHTVPPSSATSTDLPKRMAIVGAKIYSGNKRPQLRGALIIADMSGWIGALARQTVQHNRIVFVLMGQGNLPRGETVRALCKTADGIVYALTHNKGKKENGGTIWEISI